MQEKEEAKAFFSLFPKDKDNLHKNEHNQTKGTWTLCMSETGQQIKDLLKNVVH